MHRKPQRELGRAAPSHSIIAAILTITMLATPVPALAALPGAPPDHAGAPAERQGEGQPQEGESSERQSGGQAEISKPRTGGRRERAGRRRGRRDSAGGERGHGEPLPAGEATLDRSPRLDARRDAPAGERLPSLFGERLGPLLEKAAPGLARVVRDAREILALPEVRVDLMRRATRQTDPFFERVVDRFHEEATRPHPKIPLVPALRHGVALCPLPPSFEGYLSLVEPSARRNVRKAERLGYEVRRVRIADHEDDVIEILRSAPVRQGKMPERLLSRRAPREVPPPPRTDLHDYPHYAVLKDGRVYAYAGCLVAGELCIIESIYGHAERQPDGVVPLLVVSIAREIYARYPRVRYYAYGTYYGASDSMRRFKKKLAFRPHRVRFALG